MSKREDDKSPKIWNDSPGCHFNAYWELIYSDERLHERGLENKIRWDMGKRMSEKNTLASKKRHMRQSATLHAKHALMTLPTLKWGKD